MKSSEALKKDLEALEAESKALLEERKAIEIRQDEVRERLIALHGGTFNRSSGEIDALKREIEKAELLEADQLLPSPVWEKHEPTSKSGHVISKVTPKRIYVRDRGSVHEIYYAKETGRHRDYYSSIYGELDVPATLAAWKEYETSQKKK